MTEAETVLVTGGTGVIGSHLAEALIDDGHEVVAFDAAPNTSLLERLGIADAVCV
jgi:nucleoside-diphosphate-sugar epimerase